MAEVQAHLSQQSRYDIEYRLLTKSGEYRWFHGRGQAIWDSKTGKPTRMAGVISDITERKQADMVLHAYNQTLAREVSERTRDLKATSEHLSLLLEHLPAIIFTCQAKDNFAALYISNNVEKITGYTPEQFLLEPNFWVDHLYPEDKPGILANIHQIFETERYEHEYRWQIADGSYKWFLAPLRLTRTEEEQSEYIVGIMYDITQRKQSEMALCRAKQAAEAANQAKTVFLASMSHELRTPLNGILDYTQQILSRSSNLTQKQKDNLHTIQRSGEHLLTIINDILDVSKIEANKLKLLPSTFYFIDFLKDIVEMVKLQAEQKELAFFYQNKKLNQGSLIVYRGNLPLFVQADEKRLRQILLNLLSNAIKFTEKGSIHFKVTRKAEQVTFIIKDSGVGIAPDEQQAIFLPFHQVIDNKPKIEGTGLGLSIALGFQMLEAQDGQAALKKIYQHAPEVIITDLPLLDGFELIRRLRCSKQFSKTIIFVVSTSFFEYNQLAYLKCDAFIEKPIDIQVLLNKLQTLLPIKWIYQDPVSQLLEDDVLELNAGPPAEQAAILLRLTETVTQLAQQNTQLTAFAKEVKYLANHYELHKLENLIHRYV